MPSVTIDLYAGRTLEQKRALVKNVTDAIVNTLKVAPEAVRIKIIESSKENSAQAGVLVSDKK